MTWIFIEGKFDQEFDTIYSLFEYLYAATKNRGSEDDIIDLDDEIAYQRAIMNNTQFEENYVKKISDLLSPEQCIRIMQKFLNNGHEDYALSLLNNVVDTSTEYEEITIDKDDFIKKLMVLIPSITQYKHGTSFYPQAKNILLNSIEKTTTMNIQKIQQKAQRKYYKGEKKLEKLTIINAWYEFIHKRIIIQRKYDELLDFLEDPSTHDLLFDIFQHRRLDGIYRGKTLLHFIAEQEGFVENITNLEKCWDILLSLPNIDLNIQDNNGDTPLHIASSKSNSLPMADIARIKLERAGARTNIKNKLGKTPSELTNFDENYFPFYPDHEN